jgi:hypothetical protein
MEATAFLFFFISFRFVRTPSRRRRTRASQPDRLNRRQKWNGRRRWIGERTRKKSRRNPRVTERERSESAKRSVSEERCRQQPPMTNWSFRQNRDQRNYTKKCREVCDVQKIATKWKILTRIRKKFSYAVSLVNTV